MSIKLSALAIILFSLVSALWFITTGFSFRQSSERLPSQLPTTEKLSADIHIENMRVIEQVDTTSDWEVLAQEAKVYQGEQRTELYEIAAHLSRPHDPSIHLTAIRGQVDIGTGDMAVAGEVRLRYQGGYTIETDRLQWRATDGTLYTEAPVAIHNPSVHIAGTGLQSKVDQQRIAIQRDVRASFRLQSDQ